MAQRENPLGGEPQRADGSITYDAGNYLGDSGGEVKPDNDTLFLALLGFTQLGRGDVYAERRPPKPPGQPKWWYCRLEAELTKPVLEQHLNGGPHVGMYLLLAGSASTRVAVYDLDDHDGTGDPAIMQATALRVRDAARRYGIATLPVRSGGGRGIHLWAKWEQPQPARDVRWAMIAALAEVGLRDGTAGIAKGEVEVFPKQDTVGANDYGSLVALPFARASVPLDEVMQVTSAPLPWEASVPVPPAPPEAERAPIGDPTAPIEDITAALAVIPNDETISFEYYISVGMEVAASSAYSDGGLAAWKVWASRRTDKYGERDCEKRWDYWRKKPPNQTGFGALVKKARAAVPGWLPPSQPAPFLSEQWLALGFVAEHRDDMRYTAKLNNTWHIWNGALWVRDDTLRAFSLAAEACLNVAKTINKPGIAKKLSDAKTRAAVHSLARENPALAAVTEQWNRDPWLLGTPGGTVDLRTGELRESRPEDYITKATAATPGGDCPLWKAKLHEICAKDDEVVGFLQRWFGYCLTGLTREEMLAFFQGEGSNGKGTVIETVAHVMGDYAVAVAMTTLVKRQFHEHPTEIAKLHGARLAVASETDDGGRINASMIKRLTGGDVLTARFMRADYFDFLPTHKLVISGNHPLILGRVDDALKRRWVQIPFEQKFTPDKMLKERLRKEAGGILAWLVDGCLEWQRVGLAPPKVIVEATDQYLREQDDIALFVDEKCHLDENVKTAARGLYDNWRLWCANSGIYPGKMGEFVERMKRRFKYTTPKNRGFFHGIGLIEGAETLPAETVVDVSENTIFHDVLF